MARNVMARNAKQRDVTTRNIWKSKTINPVCGCLITAFIFTLIILNVTTVTGAETSGGDDSNYMVPRFGTPRYAVVIDAGSSGSKVFVYKWDGSWGKIISGEHGAFTRRSTVHKRPAVPHIEQEFYVKVKPGLATLMPNSSQVLDYMLEVLRQARQHVPVRYHAKTVLMLYATAGLRVLLEDDANTLIDQVDRIFLRDENPFQYESGNCRVLSGEEEGVFAWITVNYATGFFHGRAEQTVGVLEKGGASSQIVFQPEGDIMADKFPVKVGGDIYPLYAHSYLYYGSNLLHQFVRERIVEQSPGVSPIDDPCWPTGYNKETTILGQNVTFRGSGDPETCLTWLNKLVYHAEPYRCHPKPCAIGTVYQPSIPKEKLFYALGNFIHPPRNLGILDSNGTFVPEELARRALTYCKKSRSEIEELVGRTDFYLADDCVLGLFVPLLLIKGYGFDNDTTNVRAVTDLNDVDMSWALGALIYEEERRDWVCIVESRPAIAQSHHLTAPWPLLTLTTIITLSTLLNHRES